MVLTKKEKGPISLGRKPRKPTEVKAEAPDEPYYPSFYVRDIDLGLREEDAGEDLDAKVKLHIRRVTKTVDNKGKKTQDYEIEVKSVKFV